MLKFDRHQRTQQIKKISPLLLLVKSLQSHSIPYVCWYPLRVQVTLVHQATHEARGNGATALHVAAAGSDGNQTWDQVSAEWIFADLEETMVTLW